MSAEAHMTAETFEVQTDEDDDAASDDPDIWVAESFENRYGDQRAVLKGDTYDAKEIIKFDWETTHHDWDGQREAWIVDENSLFVLRERLAENGFELDPRPPEDVGDDDHDDALFDAHEAAEPGDRIEVVYEQKNGEGTNTKAGEVQGTDFHSGKPDKPKITFYRDDGHPMYIRHDKYGKIGLYTARSHSPFVGAVTEITIESEG
jgi:hypothetical protein